VLCQYPASNADIARQNIDRLKIPGCEEAAQATRLTLLPLQMQAITLTTSPLKP